MFLLITNLLRITCVYYIDTKIMWHCVWMLYVQIQHLNFWHVFVQTQNTQNRLHIGHTTNLSMCCVLCVFVCLSVAVCVFHRIHMFECKNANVANCVFCFDWRAVRSRGKLYAENGWETTLNVFIYCDEKRAVPLFPGWFSVHMIHSIRWNTNNTQLHWAEQWSVLHFFLIYFYTGMRSIVPYFYGSDSLVAINLKPQGIVCAQSALHILFRMYQMNNDDIVTK